MLSAPVFHKEVGITVAIFKIMNKMLIISDLVQLSHNTGNDKMKH